MSAAHWRPVGIRILRMLDHGFVRFQHNVDRSHGILRRTPYPLRARRGFVFRHAILLLRLPGEGALPVVFHADSEIDVIAIRTLTMSKVDHRC